MQIVFNISENLHLHFNHMVARAPAHGLQLFFKTPLARKRACAYCSHSSTTSPSHQANVTLKLTALLQTRSSSTYFWASMMENMLLFVLFGEVNRSLISTTATLAVSTGGIERSVASAESLKVRHTGITSPSGSNAFAGKAGVLGSTRQSVPRALTRVSNARCFLRELPTWLPWHLASFPLPRVVSSMLSLLSFPYSCAQ